MPENASGALAGGAPPAKPQAVFMGTPDFALPSLYALVESDRVELCAVFTQPDRPSGRGMRFHAPAIKEAAQNLGIPVFQPEKLTAEIVQPILDDLPALDFIVVVAYGRKIPKYLLEYSRYGCINLHPSLLPKYRGGDPIRRVLFDGQSETGVTTMYLDEGWDTGDLILQEKVAILPDANYGQLSQELAQRGATLLLRTLQAILDGSAPRTKQDERLATHYGLLTQEDEWVDWSWPAKKIFNRIRGLAPEPSAHTIFRDKSLRILRGSLVDFSSPEAWDAGTVVASSKGQGIVVATGSGFLRLEQVQPEGKKPMDVRDFQNGYKIQIGEKFKNYTGLKEREY